MSYNVRCILTLATSILILSSSHLLAGWEHLGLGNLKVNKLKLLGDQLYAGTNDGVYTMQVDQSSAEWGFLGLSGLDISALLVINSDTIFAGRASGTVPVYRTTNAGVEWTPFENGYGGGSFYPVYSFERESGVVSTIYATGTAVTAKSTDCGWSWEVVYGGTPPFEWNPNGVGIWFVKVDPNDQEIVWTGGESMMFQPVLMKSTDAGLNWISAAVPYTGDNACHDIAVSHSNSLVAYVSTEGIVYKTTDGGESWGDVLENNLYIYGIEIDSLRSGSVYTSGGQLGTPLTVYFTGNGGSTWFSSSEGTHDENWAYDIVLASEDDQNILYLGTDYGVYRFTDLLNDICGDVNASDAVDIDDPVYLINYIFVSGPPPDPYEAGDADCSGAVDIDDVVWLIAYIFSGGNVPCDNDGDGVPDC